MKRRYHKLSSPLNIDFTLSNANSSLMKTARQQTNYCYTAITFFVSFIENMLYLLTSKDLFWHLLLLIITKRSKFCKIIRIDFLQVKSQDLIGNIRHVEAELEC